MYRVILNSTNNQQQQQAIATIGNFDGLHLGHQELLQTLNSIAKQNNYWRILITFESLPQEYFQDLRGIERSARLSLLRDKYIVLKEGNFVDELVVLHFNSSMAKMTPDEFIQQILINKLNIRHVVVGHDFRFGYGGLGDINSFAGTPIIATEFAPHCVAGDRVSSSMLREFATQNKLSELYRYLGHN